MAQAKVLVVDDDSVSANTIAEIVTQLGHRALIAVDGLQAMTYIQNHRPDLVVLDFQIPAADGATVYQRMQTNTTMVGRPVIFVSAHSREILDVRLPKGPKIRFFAKPFDIAQFRAALVELLPQS